MYRLPSLVPVLLLAALAACSTVDVDTDFDPGADFSAFATYAWIPATPSAEFDQSVIDRIEAAVDAGLAEKGLRKAPEKEQADVLVSQYVTVQEKVQVVDPYFAYGQYQSYEEGTLLLELLDAASGKLVWRGTGMVRLKQLETPEARDERVRKVVEAVLAEYPPKK